MRITREKITQEIELTRKRLDLYLAREEEMLSKEGV